MPLTFVSLKAFGDFVIACHALRRIGPGDGRRPGMVASTHLRPLAEAVGFDGVRFIAADGSGDVPAAFDVRRRGLVAAMRSLADLRRQLAALPDHGRYVFDRIGWRERFLAPADQRTALPVADNIYAAYASALRNDGHVLQDIPAHVGAPIRSAVIVPASRLAPKTIPVAAIGALAGQLSSRGIAVEVVLLEGDRAEVPPTIGTHTIPRHFSALIERLRTADLVVSADSLAAHLAEFHGIRCFVVGPRPNLYWLPDSCLRTRACCLFDDIGRLAKWLDSHDMPVTGA